MEDERKTKKQLIDELALLRHRIAELEADEGEGAKQALRESEQRYRSLFEESRDAIVVTTPEGKYVDFNQAALDLFGYTREELLETPARKLYANAANRGSHRRKMEQNGYHKDFEVRLRKKDGTEMDCLITSSERRDNDGNLTYQGIIRDITQRLSAEQAGKQAEEALRESEARFKAIFDSVTDPIIVLDRNHNYLNANQASIDHVGTTRDKVIGKNLRDGLAHMPDFLQAWLKRYEQVFETGEPLYVEDAMPLGDELIYRESTVSPIIGTDGYVFAVGVISRDVTEQKRAADKLARYAEELKRSNVELEQLAYVASHDLQEPLRMVSSYTQLLARRYKDRLDEDAQDFIDYAVDGANRMQNLINDLLAYSRVTTKGKELTPTRADDPLDQAMANLQMAIEGSGATVTRDALPTVMADGSQLAQLFQNLIDNGIKFHGEKLPEIHIGARRRDGEWLFSIRDNGIGIDPDYMERIFVIFQRLHSRNKYPGTGIGLAVCKRVAERHGGRIWVESDPGKGSTFYFTMPAVEEGGQETLDFDSDSK